MHPNDRTRIRKFFNQMDKDLEKARQLEHKMSDPLDEHPMNPINQDSYDDWTHPDDDTMSDQPQLAKATTEGEEIYYVPPGQPQEWTPEYVQTLVAKNIFTDAKIIANAHNAAIKAAYEKGKQDGIREHYVGK